jgi:exosortase A
MLETESGSRTSTEVQSSWRRDQITLLMALSVLAALFWGTVALFVTSWARDPLGHGYIIVPAVLYLAWERRHLLRHGTPGSEWLAITAVSAFALLWFIANLGDSASVQQFCFVAIVIGFVVIVLGSARARLLVFPLGFLFFGLPLANPLIPSLQDLTANFVVKLLAYSNVPVLLQGHVISIPGAAWKVAEACSGINYLTASFALGYLYAGATYRYWTHRVGFMVAAAIVPLVANGLRVYGTILLAFVAGPQSVEGTRHYLFGWIVFSFMMGVLFLACGRWRERRQGNTLSELNSEQTRFKPFPKSHPVMRTAIALMLVGTAPVTARLSRGPLDVTTGDLPLPTVSLPWSIGGVGHDLWTTDSTQAHAQFVRTYRSDNHSVELYVGFYDPRRGAQSVGDPVDTLSDAWWTSAEGTRAVTLGGHTFQVRERHLESRSASLVVWSWYRIGGTYTESKYLSRLFLAGSRLFGTATPAAVMAVAIDAGVTASPEATLQDFLLHLSVDQHFGSPRMQAGARR